VPQTYRYRALGADGNVQSGAMAAESEAVVILGLRRKGLTPLEILPDTGAGPAGGPGPAGPPVPSPAPGST